MAAQQFIVDRLNEPPFGMRLTRVAFDEKSPFELLEIVNAIMAQLSSEHQIDLRDETPDATANRMTEFLRILNFKQQMDKQNFKQALLHGDPGIIYPILTWMLQRLPELQKRSYLARFLVNIEVPEHMFSDEEVGEVYQQLKDLQEEFKETHKTSEKFKSQLISPNEIKKAIMQMEEDKSMLEQKVEGLASKLQDTERFDDMLVSCQKLRLEQDEQVKLMDRLKEQKSLLLQAEHRLNHIVAMLNEKRTNEAGEQDMNKLLHNLDREVNMMKEKALGLLPDEIMLKQRRMEELQQVLSEPVPTDQELLERGRQLEKARAVVQELEAQKKAKDNNPDDKLGMFRQQANLVGKKKEQVLQRLQLVLRERSQMGEELQGRAQQFEDVKTAQYKRMKAELAELRAEGGVLQRTQRLLEDEASKVSGFLGEQEARKGLSGYQQTQDALEQVSQQKAEVDEVKGKTLEEIAQVVEEINSQIKTRKNRLAPQIKDLRNLRVKFQEQESEYLEKKQLYDNTKAGLDTEVSKMQAEADAAEGECNHEESACHHYTHLAAIEQVKMQRVQGDRQNRFSRQMPDGTTVRSYTELYEAKLKQQEGAVKELRERQHHIQENREPNMKQVKMYKDLAKLLRCKQEMQKAARAEQSQMAAANQQDTNVFTMPDEASPADSSPTGGGRDMLMMGD